MPGLISDAVCFGKMVTTRMMIEKSAKERRARQNHRDRKMNKRAQSYNKSIDSTNWILV